MRFHLRSRTAPFSQRSNANARPKLISFAPFSYENGAVRTVHYRLREFPLLAVTNRFELRCQLKQPLLLYFKICPYCSIHVCNLFRNLFVEKLCHEYNS